MWTLQRAIQNESRKLKDLKTEDLEPSAKPGKLNGRLAEMLKLNRVSSQDSGRGSGSSYGGPFNGVFQRFPSLRGRQATTAGVSGNVSISDYLFLPLIPVISVNDSHAGLLNSYDNTGYREDSDLETSYENSDSDSQDRRHGAELSRQKILEEFEEELELEGEVEGRRDVGSDSESGVSDGPSERL